MSELPEGWEVASLPEVCELNPRKPDGSKIKANLQVTFVPMAAVDADLGQITNPILRRYAEVSKGFTAFQENDVILAKITPCMENGKAAIARGLSNGIGFGSTEFHVFRHSNVIVPEYLFYFLRQESFRRAAEAKMTGSVGQKRVPVDFLKATVLPLPPLNEQRRVVAKMEKVLGRVDVAQARIQTIPRILKRFRQSVLAAVCSGRLTADWRNAHPETMAASEALRVHARRTASRSRNTRRLKPAKGLTLLDYSDELPKTWAWLKVRELVERGAIFDVQDGNHGELYPCADDFAEIGVPYIRAEHVINDRVELDLAPRLKHQKAQQLRIGFAKANDVILTHNATVGRVALLPSNASNVVLSTSTTYYRVDDTVLLPAYLAAFLRSRYFQSQLEMVMEQTTRNQVSVTKQVEFGIAVPPLIEQQEIVRRVEALFKTADALEARYRTAKAHVDKLTQSILAKAFRGELVPQDPNDEPASVLLERIRTERNRNERKKGRRRK